MEPFQIRLNCVDHYQANPSEFDPPLPYKDGHPDKGYRPKVPVIRTFGTTETGQKICVHVHGAFPYLYVQYDGDVSPEAVRSAARSLHLSIDHALAISYRRNTYDKKAAFVAHITLVKGVPFYGYHVGYRFFFKIYLLNPNYITRLADLLLQGAVMKRPIQPYESHLQYIPQWMCDYSLYGCAPMKCSKVRFRAPIPEYLDLPDFSHRWHDRSIPSDWISDESILPKQSHCQLEADVCVQDILNRLEIKERSLHHDFSEFVKPAASEEKLVPSLAGLWQDEKRRRKKRLGLLDPDSSPFSTEDLVSFSVDPRKTSEGDWIHGDEFQRLAQQIAAEERRQDSEQDVTLDDLLHKRPFETDIKTALESIEDFYPGPNGFVNLQLAYVGELDHTEETVQDYVDENALQSPELDADSYSEDDSMVDIFSEDEDEVAEVNMLDDMSDNGETESRLQTNGEHTSMLSVEPQTEQNQPNLDYPGGIRETDFWDKRFNKSQMVAQDNLSATRSKHNTANVLQALDRTSSMPLKSSPLQTKQPTAETDNAMDGSMSGSNEDHQTSQGGSALSQSTIRPRGNGLNSTLNFPVVKDPSDPMTILRFSQEASSSKNLQSLLEKEASSPTKSEDISKLISSTGTDVSSADGTASEIAALLYDAFSIPPRTPLGCLRRSCPSPSEVTSTLHDYGHPSIVYPRAHYSNDSDVPDRPREYAGREFRLEGTSVRYLPDFDPSGRSPALLGEQAISRDRFEWQEVDHNLRMASTSRVWEFAPVPPSRSEVITWFENQQHETLVNAAKPKGRPKEKEERGKALSQIEAPTQKNDFGFKYSQNKSTRVEHQAQYMSTMSLEVHVNTRGGLSPNPEEDEISSFFWCITSAEEDLEENGALAGAHVGVVFQGEQQPESKISKALRIDWEHEQSELDLINRLIDIVRLYDPDIITGYEVHNSSWGYIIERARKKYDFDLCDELSRVKSQAHGRFGREADKWGFNHTSSIRVTGRHIINIWRAMRSELNLLQYTMENVVFHLLHWRIPHYSFRDLTAWFQSDKPRDFMKVVNYYTSRVQINIEILEENELIPRTSEQARLLGIDFFSVFSRGSQFKVESLMFRIAKPENFILVSPSRKQVGQQNALECLPLVMEPQSDFYTSPLLVLDFQSLYPSIMIAYNYCYSTFLGRVQSWRGRNKMGFTDYNRQPRLLELLRDHINIAPNGMMYAKPEVRKSLLAKMLAEILETRVMVKAGMKMDKDDRALQRLLNNRQLALKLIANVTYGYTSASFSGRMPCSEIADSIVQSGRETLEKAIAFIHSVERWGAEVVYGDTDSLFVYLKGRTREEAFDIGEEIAKAVTQINPHPVKLKFEKVYHPCVLLAKKRYVGFKYEHRDQKEPEFDAKGIETVRRDGTPAEQKIEERILKLLFRTADLSQVKSYFQSQCMKIMQGRVSVQDFCFARAVKLGTYSERGTLPAGALISTKRMLEDPRAEPQYGERVPYVVVTGAPGSRLIDRCVPPETLLQDAQLDLDAEYYITKNLIPPLERILNLVGANVRQWYDEMPKFHRMRRVEGTTAAGRSSVRTLETYMKSSTCIVCKAKLYDTEMPFCPDCLQQPHVSLLDLVSRLRQAEQKVANLERVCRSCMDVPFGDEVKCDSLDCPVFYARTRSVAHWKHTSAVLGPLIKFLQDNCGVGLEW